MKTVAVAALLLVLTVGGVVLGAVSSLKVVDDLLGEAEGLPLSDGGDASKALYESWKKAESVLKLTVSNRELSATDDLLSALMGAAQSTDPTLYLAERERVIRALWRLRDMTDHGLDDVL